MRAANLLTGCLIAVVSIAASLEPADGEESGGQRTQVPAAKIDEIFARWDKTNSPGAVLAVIQNGSIVYQRGYGMANLDQDIPLSPESVLNIASMSKQFTAASIVILARQGRLSLDDDVHKYFPELPDYGASITIRHLIHHTSGLRDDILLNVIAGRTLHGFTTDDAVKLIVQQKELNSRPGEEYSYTNSGYSLMAEIIKRTSGKALRPFADEHIFRPLGMTHSVFCDDNTMILKHRAAGYAPVAHGFRNAESGIEAVGPGNMWTTVGNLLLWDQNFYNNRLGDGLIDELLTPGKLTNGQPLTYAYGLYVDEYKGVKRVQHSGSIPGFCSYMARFPDNGISVICLANLSSLDPADLAQRVADLYLADHLRPNSATLERPQRKLKPEELAAFAATYRDRRDGGLWTFIVVDGSLAVERPGRPRAQLQRTGGATFSGRFARRTLVCEFFAQQDGQPLPFRSVH
jgi:CubicO group peptidase (beta-lactamase class C family)